MHNKEGSQAQVACKISHWLADGVRSPKVIESGQEHSECCKSKNNQFLSFSKVMEITLNLFYEI